MKKRILSMVMVLVMLISMLPAEVIALTTEGVYEKGDTIWLAEGQTPNAQTVEGHHWALTGESKQETEYVCGLAPHTHVTGCSTDEAGAYTCGGHVHSDDCVNRVYEGCVAHAHGASCTVYACGLTASSGHLHTSACKQLVCTTPEGEGAHTHSEACAPNVSYICTPAEGEEHTHTGACETVTYGCGLTASVGHIHGDGCYQLICTIPEGEGAHAHTEACGSATVVCGMELHAHTEDCVYTDQYTCGEEGHTHVQSCTLVCQSVEEDHVHTGECFSCGMIEHAHSETCGTVVTYVQWAVVETVSEVVQEAAAAADTTYTVTLRAEYTSQQSSTSYQRNVPITVYALDGETRTEVGTYTTSDSRSNPTATASLPAGTYVAVVEYTSGSYTYVGEEYFTVTDEAVTVTVTLERLGSAATAEQRYDNLVKTGGTFDHVDIRVNGNYVLVDGTGATQSAAISNVYLTVVTNGATVVNNVAISANDTNQTYEWRTTGLRLDPENTQVIVTFDMTVGGKTYEDITVTYSSKADFIRAIQNCDAQQGLDFVVSVTEIKEAIEEYTVTYQWRVRNEDGSLGQLPEHAPAPPASTSGHEAGEQYAYDTEYGYGDSFIDPTTGLMYTFQGWAVYSHSSEFSVTPSETVYAISGSTIEITADTWINGIWVVTQLPPASAYITIAKVFDGDYPADAEKLWFRIDTGYDADGDGVSSVDVDYAMMGTGSYQIPVYQYDTPFVITEHKADVLGYTRTTTATAAGDNVETFTYGNDAISVTLKEAYVGENVFLGGITFTNSYTKNVGEDLDVLPYLSVLKSADDGANLPGATFTLTASDGTVYTGTSEEDGYVHFTDAAGTRLTGIPAGIYTLVETVAPTGYALDDTVYTVTVTAQEPVEELRQNTETGIYEFVQVTYHTLAVEIPEGSDAKFNTSGEMYRLHVYNTPVTGSLTISKAFKFYDAEGKTEQSVTVPTTAYMEVIVTGTDSANSDYSQTITVAYNDTTKAWEGSLTDIPVGNYKFEETFASIHGYNWQEDKVQLLIDGQEATTFTVSPDGTVDSDFELAITNIYYEWEYVDFYLQKYETGTTTALQGAEFTLYDANGGVVATGSTDAYGRIHFQNLGDGTYTLKETKAPAGYEAIDTEWEVKVTATTADGITTHDITIEEKTSLLESLSNFFSGGISGQGLDASDVLVVYNTPITGSITINKVLGEGNDLTEEHKIMVSILGPDGLIHKELTVNAGSAAAKLKLTDLRLGEYTITEYNADKDAYTLITSYTVGTTTSSGNAKVTLTEENADAGVEVTITNVYDRIEKLTETTASFTVKKVDQDGKALSGASFTLTGPNSYNRTYVTNDNGEVLFPDLKGVIDANGSPVSTDYTLVESKAPAGYARETAEWKVTVEEDDGELRVIEPTEDKSFFENIWDWIVGGFAPTDNTVSWNADTATFTVENKALGDLTISKAFVDADGKAITDIPDDLTVTVNITGPNDYSNSVTLDAEGGWSTVLKDLEEGEYTITEAAVSLHGYTWNGVTYSNESDTASVSNETVVNISTSDISLVLTNHYTLWDEAKFEILKTNEDGTIILPGAVFTLYADSAKTQVVDTQTTDSNGKATFSGFTVAAGETRTYYLEETTAPDNYAKDDTLWTVTVSHDGNGYDVSINPGNYNTNTNVLTVKNTEILGELTIKKTFGQDNDYTPEEIKVDITGNDYSNTITLNGQNFWTQTISGLKMGTYTIQEQDATTKGYDLTVTYNAVEADNITVTLDEAAGASTTANIIIENTYTIRETTVENPASFQVMKVNEKGEKLSGATFTLYEADGTTPVASKTTGTNGLTEPFENLKGAFDASGKPVTVTYILKETAAPTGYVATDATWQILVTEDDGQVTIELNETDNIFQNIWNWIIGKDSTGTWDGDNLILTITNAKRTGKVSVTKEVDVEGLQELDDTAKALMTEEYTFTLTVDGTVVETIKVKGGATGTFAYEIPYGSSYAVEEVTRGGTFTVAMSENSKGIMDTEAELDNGITVNAVNTYTFRDDSGLELEFLKISSSTKKALKGASFTLYSDKECKTVVAKYTTGTSGVIVIDDITEPGTYYLKETSAPSGYVKLSKAIEIVAEYEYSVSYDANGDPIIYRTLVAEVTGKTANDDGQYVITNTPSSDNPKTSDSFQMTLWIGIMAASAAILMVLLIAGKKRRA